MEFISYHAIFNSSKLAKERGKYESYEGSKWSQGILPIDSYKQLIKWKKSKFLGSEGIMDWSKLREHVKKYGMRNSNTMAIAPNASIAYQLGCEQSIEPFFSMLFRYENKSGNYYITNHNFVNDMKAEGLWSSDFAEALKQTDGDVQQLNIPDKYKELYKTAFDRDQNKLIEATAARQKWIDQSISFNIYNAHTSLKFLNDVYLYSNDMCLKSTYYLRNKAASKIQKVAVDRIVLSNDNGKSKVLEDKDKSVLSCSIESTRTGGTCEMCEG